MKTRVGLWLCRLALTAATLGLLEGCSDDVSAEYPGYVGREYLVNQPLCVIPTQHSGYAAGVPATSVQLGDMGDRDYPRVLSTGTRLKVTKVARRREGYFMSWSVTSIIATEDVPRPDAVSIIISGGVGADLDGVEPYYTPVVAPARPAMGPRM